MNKIKIQQRERKLEEILELESTITAMKNSLERFKDRFEQAKERFGELEDRSMGINQV